MGFYKNTNGVLTPIAGGVSYSYAPIGAIYPYGGSSAPSGYLMCDGSAVSRTDYSALFAVIGTSFGSGDGSTTFNVPDLREAVPVGTGENGTQTIAEHDVYTLGEFKDDQLQQHTHTISGSGGFNYTSGSYPAAMNSGGNRQSEDAGTTGRFGTTTHGKQLGVNYIIKAKDVNLSVGGQALADRVETLENAFTPIYKNITSNLTAGAGVTTLSGSSVKACQITPNVFIMVFEPLQFTTVWTGGYVAVATIPKTVFGSQYTNTAYTGQGSLVDDSGKAYNVYVTLDSAESVVKVTLRTPSLTGDTSYYMVGNITVAFNS